MRGRSACSLASAAARSLIGAVLVARAVPVAQLLAGRVAVGARFVAAHGDAVGTACSKYGGAGGVPETRAVLPRPPHVGHRQAAGILRAGSLSLAVSHRVAVRRW